MNKEENKKQNEKERGRAEKKKTNLRPSCEPGEENNNVIILYKTIAVENSCCWFIHFVCFFVNFWNNIFFLFLILCYDAGKEGITTVAVKTLKENATEAERQDLHSELNVSMLAGVEKIFDWSFGSLARSHFTWSGSLGQSRMMMHVCSTAVIFMNIHSSNYWSIFSSNFLSLHSKQVMKSLEPHVNVVRLLGSCSEKEPILVILEYVNRGKLQTYLRNSRAERYDFSLFHSNKHITKLVSHEILPTMCLYYYVECSLNNFRNPAKKKKWMNQRHFSP